jgi:pimeloyl-ACP methyl ester carboxylesterase
MAEETGKADHVTTSDGVRLHYVEAGAGKPVVMIPGWSQTAAQFKYQIVGLQERGLPSVAVWEQRKPIRILRQPHGLAPRQRLRQALVVNARDPR